MLCQIIHVVLTWFFAMTLPCPAPTRPLANSSLHSDIGAAIWKGLASLDSDCTSSASSALMRHRQSITQSRHHGPVPKPLPASYSPLTLIGMRLGGEPVWAWVIFGIVWLAAIVGTSLSFRKMKRQSYLETACYVLMGLTILIAFKPFYDSCGLAIVLWVVGEGIAYITGAVLYSFKKIPYIHSVFHVFVILGDICHMVATWKMIQLFIK